MNTEQVQVEYGLELKAALFAAAKEYRQIRDELAAITIHKAKLRVAITALANILGVPDPCDELENPAPPPSEIGRGAVQEEV